MSMRALAALGLLLAALAAGAAEPVQGVLLKASAATFSRPHDLALSPDAQYLYVADVGNDVVKVLDPRSLTVLGEIGRGQLASPHDVAFDRDGRLMVADSGNDRIVVYAVEGAEGRFIDEIAGGLGSPEGVAPWMLGSVVVTNASLHSVVQFVGRKPALKAGSRGIERDQFDRPHDVAVNRSNRLFIADPGNDRVVVLDSTFKVLQILGGNFYDFAEPKYLAFDEADRLYVADQDHHRVQVFGPDFARLAQVGGAGELDRPEGVEARHGLVWVSDTGHNRVLLYRLDLP